MFCLGFRCFLACLRATGVDWRGSGNMWYFGLCIEEEKGKKL